MSSTIYFTVIVIILVAGITLALVEAKVLNFGRKAKQKLNTRKENLKTQPTTDDMVKHVTQDVVIKTYIKLNNGKYYRIKYEGPIQYSKDKANWSYTLRDKHNHLIDYITDMVIMDMLWDIFEGDGGYYRQDKQTGLFFYDGEDGFNLKDELINDIQPDVYVEEAPNEDSGILTSTTSNESNYSESDDSDTRTSYGNYGSSSSGHSSYGSDSYDSGNDSSSDD